MFFLHLNVLASLSFLQHFKITDTYLPVSINDKRQVHDWQIGQKYHSHPSKNKIGTKDSDCIIDA
jgi:hypothetical protein